MIFLRKIGVNLLVPNKRMFQIPVNYVSSLCYSSQLSFVRTSTHGGRLNTDANYTLREEVGG